MTFDGDPLNLTLYRFSACLGTHKQNLTAVSPLMQNNLCYLKLLFKHMLTCYTELLFLKKYKC